MASTNDVTQPSAEWFARWLNTGLAEYFTDRRTYSGFAPVGNLRVWLAYRDSQTIDEDVYHTVYAKLEASQQAEFRKGIASLLTPDARAQEIMQTLMVLATRTNARECLAPLEALLDSGALGSEAQNELYDTAYDAVMALVEKPADAAVLLKYARHTLFRKGSWTGITLSAFAEIDPDQFSSYMDEFEVSMSAQAASWGTDARPPENFAEDFIRSLGRERLLAVLATKGPAWDWLRNAIAKI
jgi:hypothetical protein